MHGLPLLSEEPLQLLAQPLEYEEPTVEAANGSRQRK